MRGEVQSRLVAKLGAENPLVKHVMNSLYDVEKRFGVDPATGRLAVKFTNEWGDEHKPLEEGINELFAKELKSFVSNTKADRLPSTGNGRGKPLQRQSEGESQPPSRNPIASVLAQHYATQGEMDTANAIVSSFAAQEQSVSSKSSK
jgi:hypothetical protein